MDKLADVVGSPEPELQLIDKEIKPVLYQLNKKGYRTIASCAGHTERVGYNERVCVCVVFDRLYDFPVLPETYNKRYNVLYGDLRTVEISQGKVHALYYFTSRKSPYSVKEKERKMFLKMLYRWSKAL